MMTQKPHYSSFLIKLLCFCLLIAIISVQAQTPTAKWVFSAPDTTSSTSNQYNQGSPVWYTTAPTVWTTSAATIGNGYYFEQIQFACTASGTPYISTTLPFSVSFWFYVEGYGGAFTSQQNLLCKFNQINKSYVNERWCIIMNGDGQLGVEINSSPATTSANNLKSTIITSLQASLGWNLAMFVFSKTDTDVSSIIVTGYLISNAQPTPLTGSFTYQVSFTDDVNSMLCFGGQILGTSTNTLNNPYTGILNEVSLFSGAVITQIQFMNSFYSTSCNAHCSLCKLSDSPNCIQDQAQYIEAYDFRQPKYSQAVLLDLSNNKFDLLVETNFKVFPIFVPNVGMYFDPTFGNTPQRLVSKGANNWQGLNRLSWTIEMWVRPYQTPTSNQFLFIKMVTSSTYQLALYWTSATQLTIALSQGNFWSINTGLTSAQIDQWFFVSASYQKLNSAGGSKTYLCLYWLGNVSQCWPLTKAWVDTGTMYSWIGYQFKGYIRDLKVYDYAKAPQDITSMVANGSSCATHNDKTCLQCPIEVNDNATTLQCIPQCQFFQYGDKCQVCYPGCRSCYDSAQNTCNSCYGALTYDLVGSCSSICGDYIVDNYEQCDDGNTISGDGCSSTCIVENGWWCSGGSYLSKNNFKQNICRPVCGDGIMLSTEKCDDNNTSNGDGCDQYCNIEKGYSCQTIAGSGKPSQCTSVCGDGFRIGNEVCDDGNNISGDGCNATCFVESGFQCLGGNIDSKDNCTEVCGSGISIYGSKECDDGNSNNNDGCNSACLVEVGWDCTLPTVTNQSICHEICGDARNFHTFQNECDDGNTISGDGCNTQCLTEKYYSCSGGSKYTKDTCKEICGDGVNLGFVQCDDGNVKNGDGCHSDCTIENGWTCSGGSKTSPDICSAICGDGKVITPQEQCDDGNLLSGDGCSSNCTLEHTPGFNWSCMIGDIYTATKCTMIVQDCGTGKKKPHQMCNDGNLVDGDGCDSQCQREKGYTCIGNNGGQSTCFITCGDAINMGSEQCDDGNLVSGDGCSINCTIENGWVCGGGSHKQPDYCLEVCGDGIRVGSEFSQGKCDDGNIAAGDGCSSECWIEDGFTCKGGTSNSADTCQEICGDGKQMNFNIHQCDDNNTISGDGCNATCFIETGYQCGQGGFNVPSKCEEICGDGITLYDPKGERITNLYQCDDGNNQNEDGCSQYCQIERGYQCKGGSPDSKDVCWSQSSPIIDSAYFTTGNKQIVINFNQTVYLEPKWSKTNWFFNMDGPFGNSDFQDDDSYYYFDWELVSVPQMWGSSSLGVSKITINFAITQQLFGNQKEKLTINFVDRSHIKSVDNKIKLSTTSVIIYPFAQEDTSDYECNIIPFLITFLIIILYLAYCGVVNTIGLISILIISISCIVSLSAAFIGHSMTDLWNFMLALQIIYAIPSMSIMIPSCVVHYVNNFSAAVPVSPNLASTFFGGIANQTYLASINPLPIYQFQKMGYDSSAIIANIPDLASLFAIIFILCICITAFRMIWDKNVYVRNLLSRFTDNALISFALFGFGKMVLTSHLNLKYFKAVDSQTSISVVIAMGIGIFVYSFTIYIGYQTLKFYFEIRRMLKATDQFQITSTEQDREARTMTWWRGLVLFEDISIKSQLHPLPLIYPILSLLKRIALSVILISNDYQKQLAGYIIIQLVMVMVVLLIMPFKSVVMNAQVTINEMILFLLSVQAYTFLPKPRIDIVEFENKAQIFILTTFGLILFNFMIIVIRKLHAFIRCKVTLRHRPEMVFEEELFGGQPEPEIVEELPTLPSNKEMRNYHYQLSPNKKGVSPVKREDYEESEELEYYNESSESGSEFSKQDSAKSANDNDDQSIDNSIIDVEDYIEDYEDDNNDGIPQSSIILDPNDHYMSDQYVSGPMTRTSEMTLKIQTEEEDD